MAALRASIGSVRIRGYRSCKKTSFSLDPAVTALIGPNGAGKTNILQALRLLSTRTRRGLGYDDDAEGSFIQACRIEVDFCVKEKIVKYRGKFLLRPGENNTEVVVDRIDKWNFANLGEANKWVKVSYRPFPAEYVADYYDRSIAAITKSPGKSKALLFCQGSKSADGFIIDSPAILRSYHAVREFMSRISYYSASGFTNPAMCPTSFELGDGREARQSVVRLSSPNKGGAHLLFLRNLYAAKEENSSLYDQYLSIIGKTGAGLVEKINWKTSRFQTISSEVQSGGKVIKRRTQRTLLIPTVIIGGDELSFNQLSEGTFRALAVLFYILRGDRELLLLEEPEVCVHHGLLDSVIAVIREISHLKQVVVSTHSDAVLDMLAPENIRLTKLLGSRGTVVSALSNTMSAKGLSALRDYLENTGNLGEYWKHSGFN